MWLLENIFIFSKKIDRIPVLCIIPMDVVTQTLVVYSETVVYCIVW
jgi:hypothetical protein